MTISHRSFLTAFASLFLVACALDTSSDEEVGLSSAAVSGAEIYVSPSGSDQGTGSITSPFKTVAKAYSLASAGTTIYLRGGTYYLTSQIRLTKSGASGNPIRLFAYPGEKPVIDGGGMTQKWEQGIPLRISGNHHHVKGLEIKNGPEGGATIDGTAANNVFEMLDVHHNGRASQYEGKGITIMGSASNNLVLNCDSHHNRDLQLGNADGFQVGSSGTGNVLRGNRAWRNSDDGYDLWNAAPVVLENNWAWENGLDDSLKRLGDGNGFKLGGQHAGKTSGGHTVRGNVAWKNPGFDENQAQKAMTLDNNTAWGNGAYNFGFWERSNTFRNNLSFEGRNATSGTSVTNSWNVSVTVAANDFASLSDAVARGPRAADGSLPVSGFLRLVAGSDLIDKGTNIGLPFTGARPDLGAFEYGETPTTPPPPPPPPTGANLIVNGGFENGGTGWEDWGNARIDTSTKSSGTASLRIGKGEGGRGQVVPVKANVRYALTLAGRAAASEGCWVGITFRDARGNDLGGPSKKISSMSFATTSLDVAVPSSFATAKLWVWKDPGSSYCWIDDVQLVAK